MIVRYYQQVLAPELNDIKSVFSESSSLNSEPPVVKPLSTELELAGKDNSNTAQEPRIPSKNTKVPEPRSFSEASSTPSQSSPPSGSSSRTSSPKLRPSQPSSSGPPPPRTPAGNSSCNTQNPPPKILYIGDSISASVNLESLEVATQAQFVTAKAYSSVYDTESNEAKQAAKFPSSNFNDVVKTEMSKGTYKAVILQAGSVDITNLNTKDNPLQYMDYFRQETIMSATNLFQTAVNALKLQPSLTKVVIMKQTPRYDPTEVDPLNLKASLALLFNNTLTNLWMESVDKHKLFIGDHNIECNGAIRESRYRHGKTGKYDGLHLFGNSGPKFYTLSVLNILRAAKMTSSDVLVIKHH